jgi:geranylgeranyl diphosphate synthase, type II
LRRLHGNKKGIREPGNQGIKGSPLESLNPRFLESRLEPRFERALQDYFPASDRTPVNVASRYALFPGGKRIRPLLCITVFRACGGRRDSEVMPFACAIELIHNFSLIQDDLPCMDNDRARRGKPTLHVAFGEALALLAADALFARAFELCTHSAAPASRIVAATRELARVAGKEGIVTGQVQDLRLGGSPRPSSPRLLRNTLLRKTASLFGASLAIGATAAGAESEVIAALRRAGTDLGMLFQLTDDLLDAKRETTGASSVRVLGRREAAREAARYLKRFERAVAGCGRQLNPNYVAGLLAAGRRVFDQA